MSKPRDEADQGWRGAVGDENHDQGRVSDPNAGPEHDNKTPAARGGFLRGSGPDQQPHQQAEIVTGDMDQVALVNILPAPQPRAAHPAPVQDVSKRALNDLRTFTQGLLADLGAQPNAVVVHRPTGFLISVPARETRALGF